MPSNLSHFAINADDVNASRRFYESVLGWTFRAWGPPGFFQIQTGSDDDPGTSRCSGAGSAFNRRRDLHPAGRQHAVGNGIDNRPRLVAAAGKLAAR